MGRADRLLFHRLGRYLTANISRGIIPITIKQPHSALLSREVEGPALRNLGNLTSIWSSRKHMFVDFLKT